MGAFMVQIFSVAHIMCLSAERHLPPCGAEPLQYAVAPRLTSSSSSSLTPVPLTSPPSTRNYLEHLFPEILLIIFEHLEQIDRNSLHTLRAVCKALESIATPSAYRTLVLNERIVAPSSEIQFARGFSFIAAYTKHAIVGSHLDARGVRRVLHQFQRLVSLLWRYTTTETPDEDLWLPSDILDLGPLRSGQIKLQVEGLPLQGFHGSERSLYNQVIPSLQLSSLKLAYPEPPLTASLGPLKQFLLQCPNLKTFHYRDRGQGTRFELTGDDRLPAFTDLLLKSYDWNHSRAQVSKHWDFSRIKKLALISVPVYNFLMSVRFTDFSSLQSLHIEDWSAHLSDDHRQEGTVFLYLLVRYHINALRELIVTCHTRMFLIDAITAHRTSLRVLKLRDHTGFEDESRVCPTLRDVDIKCLAMYMDHVHTLELDMDSRTCDCDKFLGRLCAFKSLHTLTLHVQTVLRAGELVLSDGDLDYEAAVRTMQSLIAHKQTQTRQVSWRRIVINVGGWKPVMVRRLGSEWRLHNENGRYAERCFVLEPNNQGQFLIREERSADPNLPPPQLLWL